MFDNLRSMWSTNGTAARAALVIGALLILLLAAVLGRNLLRADDRVLFADLDPQDATSVVAELERMKVPYRIGADERSVLVDESQVHTTRLKLLGQPGLTLRGGVGFEIFNDTDFGMTEFAQKVNYQRALQGELTRTILALDEVRSARVHLVLPESGLFKRASQKPKASITLALKQGRTLLPEQVTGIQRLVAASVPDIAADAVTLLDQRGVALTRLVGDAADAGGAAASGTRLQIKTDIETHLARKVVAVLDRAFGPGRAIVSVDVTVDHDQIKVTEEDVLPATTGDAGVVVRPRTTTQAAERAGLDGTAVLGGGTSSTEVDYQAGRRVEQVVSEPGAIKRISVGVLLPHALDKARLAEIRQVLAMAAGVNFRRGDEIAFSSVDQFTTVTAPAPGGGPPSVDSAAPTFEAKPAPGFTVEADVDAVDTATRTVPLAGALSMGPMWLAAAVLAALAGVFYFRRRRSSAQRLDPGERDRLLAQVRQWLRGDGPQADNEGSAP